MPFYSLYAPIIVENDHYALGLIKFICYICKISFTMTRCVSSRNYISIGENDGFGGRISGYDLYDFADILHRAISELVAAH